MDKPATSSPSATAYRDAAARCRQQAETASIPEYSERLRKIADDYEVLAKKFDALAKRTYIDQ
jgi:hypothetical protein